MASFFTLAFNERDIHYPAIRQLFHEYFREEKAVNVAVAPDDDMFSYSCHYCGGRALGAMAYFRSGLSIFDCVRDVANWTFGDLSNVPSFLDFAAGHGRFTRVLAAAYPKSQIWASEIIPDAVRFQQNILGVNSIQSATNPDDFQPGRSFDYIYVGSLFTHLPDRTFVRWLKRLYELLTPNGVLAFTTHGLDHLKPDVTMPSDGIYYIPETEIPSLSTEDYGATIVSTDYVRRAIKAATGKDEHWYQNRALGFWQDLWVVSKRHLPATKFVYDQGPQGHVDYVYWLSPAELSVQCWAACICGDHKISDIRILLNGEQCGSLEINYDRPDIATHLKNPSKSWAGAKGGIYTRRPVDPWNDVLSVIAVCSGGKEHSLRTQGACSMMQFAGGPSSPGADERFSQVSSVRGKLHRALDYVIDGDWRALSARGVDFVRGK